MLTWEQFKAMCKEENRKPIFLDYIKLKEELRKKVTLEEFALSKDVPIYDHNCEDFRRMVIGSEPHNTLFMITHHLNCLLCAYWYGKHKNENKFEGVNLWEEPSS